MSTEQKPEEAKKPEKAKGMNLSSPVDWEKLHKAVFSGGGDRLAAYSERMLKTDDELPLYRHVQLLTIITLILCAIIWASFATLDTQTRGDGKVIPSSEIQVIQHQEGGIVDAFMVKEGDKVQIGQVLMRLRDVGAMSDLGASQARYSGLMAKIARLQAEAEGRETPNFSEALVKSAPEAVQEELNTFRANRLKLDSENSVLRQQVNQRQQEVNEITTRITDINRVIDLTNQEMAMIAPLVDRGSAPKRDKLQLEQQLAQQRAELNGLRAALPRSRAAVSEAQARYSDATTQFRATAQTELSQTQIESSTIGKTLGALEDRQTRTEIRSPVDGIIKDLKISTVGGVVKPGDQVMEIVPTDDQLLVEARIRPSDIAFIYPGQQAMVKFTAYDFSVYGGLKGEVVDISADTITNEKGESFYRVRVRTKTDELKHNGEILPIIPGMVATVDILTGHKTVMQYILKPFIKTLDSAMHER